MFCVLSQHCTVSSKVLALYFSILLEYQHWPGCIPSMRETRWESSWGNYRTSRWLNHWWRPFEPQRCSRKLNYPHNLFVLYVHHSVVLLPLPCVCMFVETLFDYLAECVKSSWSALRLHVAGFNHVTPTGYYLFYGVSHDSERLRPQLQRFRDMRLCMEDPDILNLVIRLKVIFFGHFGL